MTTIFFYGIIKEWKNHAYKAQNIGQKVGLKMAVNRIQKGGMRAIYKGMEVIANCSSLSKGLEFRAENGAIVASFTASDLKAMVSKSVRDHSVRKFV